ncbi:LuxR family transcriptional regulator [Nocardioides sp. SR21]|uniref:helix-turn-helix transcriptional regulator n=1 Tax=Nocardioides sp. SR21 TaxID=2919501 RepID=UPI001FA964EC|nr:LuxR family transcriptional regulator [Nocardioides sp. SR21]
MGQNGSGLWAGERDGLVGRDETLTSLRTLLDSGSRTAVVTGIAGAGKTSVLAVVSRAESADGRLVLPITCHESDQDLAYGVLVDLLAAVPGAEDVLDRLISSAESAESAESAVAAVAPDALRLRLDVLDALDRLAEQRPVVLLVDDAQWADPSSLSVLAFVARRIAASAVSIVVATRQADGPEAFGGHPVVDLPPLDDADARRLLSRAGLHLDLLTLPSVVERADGNPLALIELARALTAGPGRQVPSSVESSFRRQVELLPPATRDLLVLAGAGDGDVRMLGRVLGGEQLAEDLAAAEASGLVRVAEQRVVFVHPLARAAAYASGSTAGRLRAHRLLADAYADDIDRQVWHRAAATVVPDEDVASALAAASGRAAVRGAGTEAARLMLRAAELTPDRGAGETRTLEGLVLSSTAGHFERVVRDSAALRASAEDDFVRARAGHIHAYALTQVGREIEARLALLDVLDELGEIEPFWGWSSLTTLAVLSYRSGSDAEVLRDWLGRFERLRRDDDPFAPLVAGARAWVVAQVNPLERPADVLELVHRAPVLEEPFPVSLRATQEMMLGAAAWQLDETDVALTRLHRAVELMRRANAPGEMTQTLMALGHVQFSTGAYDAVDESARMVLDLAEARNQSYASIDGLEVRARVAGIRGETAAARELCDQILVSLPVGGTVALEASVRVILSWVHLAEQDATGAWEQLRWIFREDGEPRHLFIGYLNLAHYVATAVRAGAGGSVGPVLELAERRLATGGPRHRFQLAAAQALVAAEDAEPFHLAAVTNQAAARWPFDLANAQLEYGIWLRRRYRQSQARLQLQPALDTFTRLGTRAWADIARAELRAAGVATEPVESTAWASLTGQEREVVRRAAAGMTNPEIAAALYLSPRTVSSHLYNAFPKLGVTSRAQLRDVVGDPP